MKFYVVTVTEVYSDVDDLSIITYVDSKAFKTLEEAKENMIERYEGAKENILEYCMDDEGQLELDSYGYTIDGYGQALISDRHARVSTWDSDGMHNVVEIKIEEVEFSE